MAETEKIGHRLRFKDLRDERDLPMINESLEMRIQLR